MKLSKDGRAIWELLWQYIANEDADEDYSAEMAERLCETVLPQVWNHVNQLEAKLETIICHWCEAEVTEDEANEHYKSCTKNPLRAENEALIDVLEHCGYDPDDCIDCGGPPHNEYCRFWKIRHLLSYWEEAKDETE